ncbi:hypothetical protein [Algoriphagus aquimarinus]|uniref:Lipoprotein n=1 Tax=Algoriphagus aquimarinus TaxID=237018 RepID=A0A1I1BM57_9BACT|nr:hypothetical protein [Algoriphagus aquimarinus]SFB50706.1 hypothetical protein SAMN04489723_11497 [Algoriphagus aquimarinus]
MKIFNGAFLIFISVSLALGSCSEDQNPSIPKDPLIVERDSLLGIYGDHIDAREMEYLKVFELGSTDHTYLYGKTEGKFWLGLFASPVQKTAEYILDLDPQSSIQKVFYNPVGHSFLTTGYELIEILGFDPSDKTEEAPNSKSIIRIVLDNFDLKSSTSYLPLNELTILEYARRWKGGFLLEHSGIVSEFGKSNTQYLSTDLSESILWDCRAQTYPPLGVLYFDVDFYLTVSEHSVGGFDYSNCKSWTKNILDFYGEETCPGCTSSIKLLNQIDDSITVEVNLNGELRKVILIYRTGEVVSSEVVKG